MGAHHAVRHRRAPYPRALAVAALLLIGMGLLSASPAFAATGTYVRFAQLTNIDAGAELVISSLADRAETVVIPGQRYGGLSEYRRIEPGEYVVGPRPAGSTMSPAVSTILEAMPGTTYTLAAVGDQAGIEMATFVDDLTPPPPGQASIRVINAAPPAPALDVRWLGAEPLALGLVRGDASGYRPTAAGQVTLTVGPPGGATSALPVTVTANQIATVVVVNQAGALTTDVHVDADGPVVMPPGPVHAGFGGGAGDRVGGMAGAVVFGALGLAAAGLSAGLGRRKARTRHRSARA